MKAHTCVLLLLAAAGVAAAQSYASVADAVASLPELSMLNQQVSTITLADKLKDAGFVGTVFAPVNSGLEALQAALGGDLSAMLGDQTQVNEVFSTAVVPGKALALADLTNGMQLTTLAGNTLEITTADENGGKVWFVNKAAITAGNIQAGGAIIHEVATIVVPPEYQETLDALVPQDPSKATPTVVKTLAGGGSSSTTTSTGTGAATGAAPAASSASTAADDGVEARVLAAASPAPAATSSKAVPSGAASAAAGAAALLAAPLLGVLLL